MAQAGLGNAPLGSTPFGLGTTANGPVPPARRILAPYIDPRTGDAIVAQDGELEAMPVNRQRVMLSCLTQFGSSAAMQDWGARLPDRIDEGFADDVRSEISRALQFMVDDGSITVDGVFTETTPAGRAQVTVSYTDRQTGGEDRAIFYG